MRTIETNVYNYDELSEEAKQTALEKWGEMQSEFGYNWGDEAIETLKKGIDFLGGYLSNYSIDFAEPYRNSVTFTCNDMEDHEELYLLIESMGTYNKETLKGHGDCKLTGFSMDENFFDGVRIAYFQGETDKRELILAGMSQWENACREDYEYQFSEETLIELAECNDYEYTEEGELI